MLNKKDTVTDRYRLLIESVDGIIWEAVPGALGFTFVSDSVSRILGYTPNDWLSDKATWIGCIYDDDRDYVLEYYRRPEALVNHTLEFRVVAVDGTIKWLRNYVSLIKDAETPGTLCGVMMDITKSKQLETLERLEKQVLELNAEPNADIERLLNFYVNGLEDIFPAMKCSVLRILNNRAYNWASPSLPVEYVQAIHGLEIGPNRGSCGTAAYTGKRVIVSDIANDEKWQLWKDAAVALGLLACWSEPIIDSTGKVIATFALYYPTVKVPNAAELQIIERSASILKVIIENRLYANTISEMNNMAVQAQELANFGTWQWDYKNDTATWSDSLYRIYGIDPAAFAPSYKAYVDMIHPDDLKNVQDKLDAAHRDKTDITFEERIIRPDGCVRHLKSWFRVVTDEQGTPLKLLGANLDITPVKETEQKMQNIAWQQSHVVRAPLARIMGLVNLLNDDMAENETERKKLYDLILSCAGELDTIIRSISYHTQ